MIYPKIEGDNLYSKWHLLNNKQRKKIIKQLCDILKVINKSPLDEFKQKFKTSFSDNWHDKILNQIQNSLKKIEKNKILSADFLKAIKKFIDDNHNVLKSRVCSEEEFGGMIKRPDILRAAVRQKEI